MTLTLILAFLAITALVAAQEESCCYRYSCHENVATELCQPQRGRPTTSCDGCNLPLEPPPRPRKERPQPVHIVKKPRPHGIDQLPHLEDEEPLDAGEDVDDGVDDTVDIDDPANAEQHLGGEDDEAHQEGEEGEEIEIDEESEPEQHEEQEEHVEEDESDRRRRPLMGEARDLTSNLAFDGAAIDTASRQSTASGMPVGVWIGIAVGGVVLVAIAAVVGFVLYRHRKSAEASGPDGYRKH